VKRQLIGGLAAAALAVSGLATISAVAADAAPGTAAHQAVDARQAARDLIDRKAPALRIGKHDGFSRPTVWRGHAGLRYVSYERTYRGLPVVGGDFVVVTDADGRVVSTSVAQGRKVALGSIKAKVGKATARATVRGVLDRAASVTVPRLVVLQRGGSHLAWQAEVRGTDAGHASWQRVLVSATNGKVLATRELIAHGTGTAAYSGPNPVALSTQQSGSTYYLRDPSATTLQCQNATGNVTYSGTDDVWGNGDPTNRETGCVDALYAAQQMKGMMSSWLGRNGMNGSGGWVPIRVGLNDVNAYYDGTQVQIGHSQSGGRWISSIDVVAHEFGHGVDDKTPGGISGSGTQEFIGDAFATATEYYDNQPSPYDVPDHTIGEEVDLVGQGPIRDGSNPANVGDPSCYTSSIPTAEVHAAAGPGDHWFYLLSRGGVSKCDGTSVTGVGEQQAIKVLYNAMLMKTSSSSYLKYRTWTLTAAKNLDSTCALFNNVKNAWDAVNVPAQTADPTCGATGSVSVTNPGNKTGTVGTAISSFTMSASGGTAPYTWSATGLPAGVSIGSSTGTVSGTPTAAGTYTVTVTATAAAGGSGSTSFTFTVSGGGGGGCSGQKLANPGFESGNTGWTQSSGVIDSSTGRPARTGSWKAWLDGYGSSHTDSLSQSVTIPAGCTATLSFYVRIDSAETTTSVAYDKLTVKIGSTTLATYSNLNKSSTYALKTFNVSSFAGQTVSVSFTGVEDSSLQTSFVIDDTSLSVS